MVTVFAANMKHVDFWVHRIFITTLRQDVIELHNGCLDEQARTKAPIWFSHNETKTVVFMRIRKDVVERSLLFVDGYMHVFALEQVCNMHSYSCSKADTTMDIFEAPRVTRWSLMVMRLLLLMDQCRRVL